MTTPASSSRAPAFAEQVAHISFKVMGENIDLEITKKPTSEQIEMVFRGAMKSLSDFLTRGVSSLADNPDVSVVSCGTFTNESLFGLFRTHVFTVDNDLTEVVDESGLAEAHLVGKPVSLDSVSPASTLTLTERARSSDSAAAGSIQQNYRSGSASSATPSEAHAGHAFTPARLPVAEQHVAAGRRRGRAEAFEERNLAPLPLVFGLFAAGVGSSADEEEIVPQANVRRPRRAAAHSQDDDAATEASSGSIDEAARAPAAAASVPAAAMAGPLPDAFLGGARDNASPGTGSDYDSQEEWHLRARPSRFHAISLAQFHELRREEGPPPLRPRNANGIHDEIRNVGSPGTVIDEAAAEEEGVAEGEVQAPRVEVGGDGFRTPTEGYGVVRQIFQPVPDLE